MKFGFLQWLNLYTYCVNNNVMRKDPNVKDWIVDKVWNQFVVVTICNKVLLPAWNWLKGNWKTLLDEISAVIGIDGGISELIVAFCVISIHEVGQ